jgi:hypothetical protein
MPVGKQVVPGGRPVIQTTPRSKGGTVGQRLRRRHPSAPSDASHVPEPSDSDDPSIELLPSTRDQTPAEDQVAASFPSRIWRLLVSLIQEQDPEPPPSFPLNSDPSASVKVYERSREELESRKKKELPGALMGEDQRSASSPPSS